VKKKLRDKRAEHRKDRCRSGEGRKAAAAAT
jgi:hypothetical protein